jgi:hypothetical protein
MSQSATILSALPQLQRDAAAAQAAAAGALAECVQTLIAAVADDGEERRAAGLSYELEVRFGVPDRRRRNLLNAHKLLAPGAPFTQTDYERVAAAARQHGWAATDVRGEALLRVAPDVRQLQLQQQQPAAAAGDEDNSDPLLPAGLRAEICGAAAIEAYCRHNTLEAVLQLPAVAAAGAARQQQTVFFTRKAPMRAPADFADLEFRAALAREQRLPPQSDDPEVRAVRAQWARLPKHFRHMNRVRFAPPEGGCVFLDLSIVHTNRREPGGLGRPKAATTAAAAGLFGGFESHVEYEAELEVDPDVVAGWLRAERARLAAEGGGAAAAAALVAERVLDQLRRAVRVVMSALQESIFPIGRLERNAVLAEYADALQRAGSSSSSSSSSEPYFVGPSPVTLQREHCAPPPPATTRAAKTAAAVASITVDYCVTDKADGARALLFVAAAGGAVYLITPAMRVQSTGLACPDPQCRHMLLDGEYVTRGRDGDPLNVFAAFDLYLQRGALVMGLPFADARVGDAGSLPPAALIAGPDPASLPPYRLPRMQAMVARLASGLRPREQAQRATKAAATSAACRLTVRAKVFLLGHQSSVAGGGPSIFAQSAAILRRELEYETDGLIFTPTNTAVLGSESVFEPAAGVPTTETHVAAALARFRLPGRKRPWTRVFKWKPPERNTNDFLVTVVTARVPLPSGGAGDFYGRLKLLCGHPARAPNAAAAAFSSTSSSTTAAQQQKALHEMLLDGAAGAHPARTAQADGGDDDRAGLEMLAVGLARAEREGYRPRAFVPSAPYDADARFCCLPLDAGGHMRAENGDLIENATVVEFRFDRDHGGPSTSWGWKPILVRRDKTANLRAGEAEFGNSFTVANDNWKSMHFPVTRAMIEGSEPVVADALEAAGGGDDAYYRPAGRSGTAALAAFHNRVVKTRLLQRVCAPFPNAALLDLAVGKAGDLDKWRRAGASFVLGLDVSRDNIFNAADGAIARARARPPGTAPRCVFLPADTSLNVRSTGAAFSGEGAEEMHRVVRALFGDTPAPPRTLSPAFQNVVAGADGGGFPVAALMFALHYYWRAAAPLHGLLRNLAECVCQNGLFVGTCFDGERVFEKLRAHAYAGPDARAGANTTGSREAAHFRLLGADGTTPLMAIAKKYSAARFERGPQSLGLCVSVYMQSIGQPIDEWLVHFPYFDDLMAEYGFELLGEADMVALGFPATGEGGRRAFETLHNPNFEPRGKGDDFAAMSAAECTISFLNSAFVYRKTRTLSAERLDALHRQYVLEAPAVGTEFAAAAEASAAASAKKKSGKRKRGGGGGLQPTDEYIDLGTE